MGPPCAAKLEATFVKVNPEQYESFNTIAHGMMLDPPFTDVRAGDFNRATYS